MSPLRRLDQPYLLLTLTALFWAGNAVVGRAIVDRIPPAALAEIRWTLAFLILLPFAWRSVREELPIIRRHIGVLAFLSLTSIAAFNAMLYWSLQYTTAINATLMQSSGPLLIGLWSFLLFREPLTRAQLVGVFVSLAGIAIIVCEGHPERLASLSLNIGDVAVVVAICIYGIYSTLLRKRPGMTQLSFAAVIIGLGVLMLMPVAVAEYLAGRTIAAPTFGAVAAVIYMAVFPSILSVLFFNRGVQLIGANRAGPFLHLVPLFGAVLAIIFLGERPRIYHAIGAVLIIGGVLFASRRPRGEVRNRVAAEDQRP
jgi:drug/metabolite transporter (DMT)-like permease